MKSKRPLATGSTDDCPCGTGEAYPACCGRWHSGALHLQAPTAEALMRSRYCAFLHGLADYLQDTWHSSTRPAQPPTFEAGVQWIGLQIKQHRVLDALHAEVEFVARSKFGGRAHRLHERSRFVLEAGRWSYLAGEVQ